MKFSKSCLSAGAIEKENFKIMDEDHSGKFSPQRQLAPHKHCYAEKIYDYVGSKKMLYTFTLKDVYYNNKFTHEYDLLSHFLNIITNYKPLESYNRPVSISLIYVTELDKNAIKHYHGFIYLKGFRLNMRRVIELLQTTYEHTSIRKCDDFQYIANFSAYMLKHNQPHNVQYKQCYREFDGSIQHLHLSFTNFLKKVKNRKKL